MIPALLLAAHFGLAITPAEVGGPSNSRAEFVVKDIGKTPLTITMGVTQLRPIKGHPHAWTIYGRYPFVKLSVRSFKLSAGQSRTVTVTVNAPDHYMHPLGVAATATVPSVHQGAAISTEAVARYVVNPGAPLAPGQVAINGAQTPARPWWPWAVGGGVLAAIGAWLVRQYRRRGFTRDVSTPQRRDQETAPVAQTKVWPYRDIDGRSIGDGSGDPYGRR